MTRTDQHADPEPAPPVIDRSAARARLLARMTDPARPPAPGMVRILCTAHGEFVAWCSPPAPPCTVACPAACASPAPSGSALHLRPVRGDVEHAGEDLNGPERPCAACDGAGRVLPTGLDALDRECERCDGMGRVLIANR